MLPFRLLTLEDREIFTKYYQSCPVHYAEYSFFGLWGWLESCPLELAFDGPLCWIKSSGPVPGICGPIGDWNDTSINWRDVITKNFRPGDVILDVPREAAEKIATAFDVTITRDMASGTVGVDIDGINVVELAPIRDQWEYVYSVPEMISLKGSKYAHKRNRVRTFASNYDFDYYPMLAEDFDAVMEFQERWRAHRNDMYGGAPDETESLYDEDLAIKAALDKWDDFPFLGGIIKVDDEIIAYTIAEELDHDTLDIRFEKAIGEYAGSYQAINQLFLKNQGQGYKWVNREEDMGEEGLRLAKLSYNPVKMLEKYSVTIKANAAEKETERRTQ